MDAAMISGWVKALRKWRDERRSIVLLSQLSDERLRDIGIARGNLEHAVRFGKSD